MISHLLDFFFFQRKSKGKCKVVTTLSLCSFYIRSRVVLVIMVMVMVVCSLTDKFVSPSFFVIKSRFFFYYFCD